MTYNSKARQCFIFGGRHKILLYVALASQHPYPNYGNVWSPPKINPISPKTWKKQVKNGDCMCILHFLHKTYNIYICFYILEVWLLSLPSSHLHLPPTSTHLPLLSSSHFCSLHSPSWDSFQVVWKKRKDRTFVILLKVLFCITLEERSWLEEWWDR